MLTKKNPIKVVVAMSGGVDSSVATALLKEQGYQVSGVIMKIWDGAALSGAERRHGCYGPGEAEDIQDAREVAQTLGIDFHVLDLRQEYQTEVLDYFYSEYLSGRTPNPCLQCNHKVKFGALVSKTQDSGIEFDYFATGHYARVEYHQPQHRYLLKKARDLTKDQSYFISFLSQAQLGRSLFPLGNHTKAEVRKIAADLGLGVANKPESQDFITGGYSRLIESAAPGPILDRQGDIIGEHRGIPFYTIGQRKRLNISAGAPLYVTGIDGERNTITVGDKEELYQDELIAAGLNWVAIAALKEPIRVTAKIRNVAQETEAVVTPRDDNKVEVKFRQPQRAITPGQAIVFYDGDTVIGGGTIEGTKGGQDG